ncbi:MAG: hypothetical protein ABXS93_03840 [Sulfurimonas sp.]
MRLFFSLLFLFALLNGEDEFQRLDTIVKDIEELRLNYDHSQDELKKCQVKLLDEEQKNTLLLKELKGDGSPEIDKKNYNEKINNLKNQISYLKNIVKIKEKEIKKLKSNNKKKVKIKQKNKKCMENKINEFPKLQMRKQKPEKIVKDTAPATYRLKQTSVIYSSIDGKQIGEWEKSTSFTSKLRQGGWVKISGYFVDRKWKKAQKPMWVKAVNAFKRD